MKYVQSFYNYVVTFSSIGKSFPAKDADGPMRNVVEITDDEYRTLERREPMFRSLVDRRKYRVLDYMPDSAKPEATRINEAKAAAKAAKAENASLADENEKLKARIAELEKMAAGKPDPVLAPVKPAPAKAPTKPAAKTTKKK